MLNLKKITNDNYSIDIMSAFAETVTSQADLHEMDQQLVTPEALSTVLPSTKKWPGKTLFFFFFLFTCPYLTVFLKRLILYVHWIWCLLVHISPCF